MTNTFFPEKIRVSIGSAIVLGLTKGRLDANPTTAYLLLCRNKKCFANCSFCPQARDSNGRADMLSRVTWPIFPSEKVIKGVERATHKKKIQRVCIQSLNYPEVFEDVMFLVKKIKSHVDVPISVSCRPLNRQNMRKWAEVGVNRVSIALDAASEKVFRKVKGQNVGKHYRWKKQHEALIEAVDIFGKGSVSTHLIVGLGETEKELYQKIQWCVDSGVYPGLFAFTPILGTALENKLSPSLCSYRRAQVAHYLLTRNKTHFENMKFDMAGNLRSFGISREKLLEIIETGKPFTTSGCPGCNRPYYNERPSGPLYNYPRQLQPEEIEEAKKALGF